MPLQGLVFRAMLDEKTGLGSSFEKKKNILSDVLQLSVYYSAHSFGIICPENSGRTLPIIDDFTSQVF